jgi:ABC-2 type transport system permease protein
MFRTILTKTLRDYRIPTLSWGLGVALLMFIGFAAITPSLRAAYASVAATFRLFGEPYAMDTNEGYIAARYLGFFVPILWSIWPILVGTRLVRGEEERGTMDVVLATPQSRVRVILEKLIALAIALLVISLLMALGIIAGEHQANEQVNAVRAFLTSLNVGLLTFFFAMLALLFSQFTSNRGAATGWASGLMILAFLLDITGRIVEGSWVKYLSPVYYYNLNRPLIPTFNNTPTAVFLLLGLSLLFAVLSVVLFARRDSGRPAFLWQRNHTNGKRLVEHSLKSAERDFSLCAINLRALASHGWFSFWWLLGIAAWNFWLVLLIPSIQAPFQKALQSSPVLAKLYSGGNIGTNAGFLNAVVFSYTPIFVVIFGMTLALSWASDLENGRLELVLATPRSRWRMMLERLGAVLLMLLLTVVLVGLAIIIGAQNANLSLDQGHVIAASVSLLPLALVSATLIYALAGRLRYGAVLGLATLYIALAFLLEFLKGLLQWPDWVLTFSIFHQYGSPIIDGMNWGSFLGTTSVALVLLVLALIQFRYADVERG